MPVRRAEEQGQLRLIELGVGPDADAFWFCLKPEVKGKDPALRVRAAPGVPAGDFARGRSRGVRANGVSRRGRAGVGTDHARQHAVVLARRAALPARRRRARELLKGIGLEDRNGNGVVEDARGTEARFTGDHAARHRLVRARHGGAARRAGGASASRSTSRRSSSAR